MSVDMTKSEINQFNGVSSIEKSNYVGVDTTYTTTAKYSSSNYESEHEYYGTAYNAFMSDVLYGGDEHATMTSDFDMYKTDNTYYSH